MVKVLRIALVVGVLTLLTQIGGGLWLIARLLVKDRLLRLATFMAFYATAMLSLPHLTERQPVSTLNGTPLRSASALYPVLMRNFIVPELHDVAEDLAEHMARQFPGTVTETLDASFPFLDKFPLLPHLSHDDGQKLDLALYWIDAEGQYVPGRTKSPLGYWGYADGPSDCPTEAFDLRWDMAWLQDLLPDRRLDEPRTRAALLWLAEDSRVSRIFIEPHLLQRLGISHEKFGFQGCKAARHDDHIHLQL